MQSSKEKLKIKTLLGSVLFPTMRSRYTLLNWLGSLDPSKPEERARYYFYLISISLVHYLLGPIFWLQQNYTEHFVLKSLLRERKYFNGILNQICIYAPWFDRFAGGAEAVSAFMAQYFETQYPHATITILCDDFKGNYISRTATLPEINAKYGTSLTRTIMELKRHHFFSFFMSKYYVNLLRTSTKYDLFINSNIDVSPSNAAINLHYIHFPARKGNALNAFLFRLYHENMDRFIANSRYTKYWTKRFLDTDQVEIVEPPVIITPRTFNTQKKKLILTAGRFAIEKNLIALIDAFISSEYLVNNYTYHLIGALNPSEKEYFDTLKAKAKGYPVQFFVNLDRDAFSSQLDEAVLYWHGMGYEADLETYPERAEHFGMTVVEAMSYGCVPLVFDQGGPADIVQAHHCGFTWNSRETLVAQTEAILQDEVRLASLRDKAYHAARQYSVDHFMEKFGKVVDATLLQAQQKQDRT